MDGRHANIGRLLSIFIKATARLLVGIVAMFAFERTTTADDAKIRFKLPSCPTEMALFATDAFQGAVLEENLLKAYQPFLFAETQGAFATTSPKRPDIALLVVESSRVSEVQGNVTAEQFEQVKAAMLAKNPSSAVVEANEILREKDTVINEYNGIVQSSTETSATVSLVLDGTATGADFTSLTGFKMVYAKKCLIGVILIAPKLSVARREFEELIKQISIE